MLEALAMTSPSRMPHAVPFYIAHPAFSLSEAMAKRVTCVAEGQPSWHALPGIIGTMQSP